MTGILKLANNAVGTFAANVTTGQTTFSLGAGQGARFPALGDGEYFTITGAKPDGSREIMYVTARAFDVLTVLRAQEGTAALAFLAGEIVENRLTAFSFMNAISQIRTLVDTAIAIFEPADPTTFVTTESVKAVLVNALTTDELEADLRTRIELIDASNAVAGSVNARVKAETDSRVGAINQEITDRIANINSAVGIEASNRITYVGNYAYSKTAVDGAISAQASVTAAAYTTYADAKKTEAIAAAYADVRSYAYSTADTNSAIAASAATLTSSYISYADGRYSAANGYTDGQVSGAISTAAADVRSYAYSKSTVDGAIASSSSSLTAAYTSYANIAAGTAQSNAITAAQAAADAAQAAAISTAAAAAQAKADLAEVTAKAYADGIVTAEEARAISDATTKANAAQAAAQSAAATDATAKANAAQAAAITTSAADVRSYTYSQASINGAISASETTLRAEFASSISGYATQAYVQTYAYSKADADSAIASQTSDLRTTVGDHTTAIGINATSISGLSGKYTVKIDNNGYVTGFGLASSNNNGTPTSSFVLLTDAFRMVTPGTSAGATGIQMLDIAVIGGVPTATFAGALVAATGTFSGDIVTAGHVIASGAYNYETGGYATIVGTTEDTNSNAIYGHSTHKDAIIGHSYYQNGISGSAPFGYGVTGQTNSGTGVYGSAVTGGAVGVEGVNSAGVAVRGTGTYGFMGNGTSYDFYASNSSYYPFTGSHEGLIDSDQVDQISAITVGDIMVDHEIIHRANASNAIASMRLSDAPMQTSVIGVYTGFLSFDTNVPAGMRGMSLYDIALARSAFKLLGVNGVGEGLINVCGENGDIAKGGYITSSSIPGKGMKQDDDLHHSYTVAKAREGVAFSSPDEVKQIACTYHCG